MFSTTIANMITAALGQVLTTATRKARQAADDAIAREGSLSTLDIIFGAAVVWARAKAAGRRQAEEQILKTKTRSRAHARIKRHEISRLSDDALARRLRRWVAG